ncbi:MAG: MMPL family transporter [Deltaproteobacteria bacterium]|nr:MMPL family transporter [Deltaproteobacteria bacterium]
MKTGGLGRGERGRLVAVAMVVLALAAYVVARFEVTTDVTEFLPDAEDRVLASLSREIADSELSRTMILALEAADLDSALRASRAFEAALRRDPRIADAVAYLEGGPTEGLERALFELYEPRRLYFLADGEAEARERTSEAGLHRAAAELRSELAGPLSLLASRVAPRDPFLSLPGMFRRLERSRGGELGLVDGRFIAADDRTAILFLATRASALDARAQGPILAAIDDAHHAIEAGFPGGLRLDQSGVNRFATRAATTIEADVKRVSSISTILLCALLWILFRSLRLVALAAIPVASGVVAGAAVVLFFFGRLHGITLAFGAALIGVAIDYVVHLYCHHTIVSPGGDPRESLRAIAWPLATGAVTTLAGFGALAASSLAGLREVACFAVVGIFVAFVVTLMVVPLLMPAAERPVAARTRLVDAVERGFRALSRARWRLVWIPLAVVVFAALALPRVQLDPELANLGRMDPALLAEDERVRSKVVRTEQMQFVVALGADEAAALAVNDAVEERLEQAVEAGELEGMRSLSPLLPAPDTQRAVARVARDDPGLPDRLRRVFREEGFAEAAFAPYLASLAEPLPEPLRYEDLLASPVGALLRGFRVELGGDRVGFLTFLQGVQDADALAARLDELPDAFLLRQSDLFRDAQLAYQKSTIRLLVAGLVVVAVLLALRYRDLRRTVATLVPALLAVLLTVSILGVTGRGLDLISLTALLFVVSMGVDYSVFLVDASEGRETRGVAAALTGALLACVSTVGAFGLLAVSQHPVLADLGLTAAVGIGSSLLLAPTTLVLAKPPGEADRA